MGPEVVVVVSPCLQLLAGMGEAGEDRLVQELIAQPRVEALDEPVLVWFTRRNVVPFHIALLGPAQDGHAGQFGAIVADHRVRLAPQSDQPRQLTQPDSDVWATSARHSPA